MLRRPRSTKATLQYANMKLSFFISIISIVSSLTLVDAWAKQSDFLRHESSNDRREILKLAWTVAVGTVGTAAAVETAALESAWASGDDGGSNEDLCRPSNEKLMRQIADIQTLVEISVQASSVQAWPSAAESINDPLLDESKLSTVLLEACASSSDKKQAVIDDILDGVRSMRSKLNGVNKLATEDAMAVMSLGTMARSNLGLLFGP